MVITIRPFISCVRHSPFVDSLVSYGRRLLFQLKIKLNNGVCAVDINGGMGFGATLSHMLQVIAYCEERKLVPEFRISNRLYLHSEDVGGDWFPYYFKNKRRQTTSAASLFHAKIQKNKDYPRIDQGHLDLTRAFRLFHETITISPEIQGIADRFATDYLRQPIIGVHFRGTDKISEAPKTNWHQVVEYIENAHCILPEAKTLLIASDDLEFINFLCEYEFSLQVVAFTGTEVSTTGNAIHFSDGDNRQKGIDALSTILLLSKCQILIKTPSHLSAWARILNPQQRVIMLERPFDSHMHFPDLQIWHERLNLG